MPHDTTEARDITNVITITNNNSVNPSPTGGSISSTRTLKVPWGVKPSSESVEDLKDILSHLNALLDVVQRAHRAGHLGPDVDERLAWLQSWYTSLKLELECIEKESKPPEKK